MGLPTPTPPPTTFPPTLLKDMKDIKSSLLVLQKAVSASAQTGKNNTTPKLQSGSPQEPTNKPTGKAISSFALPPHPGVVISLANTDWNSSRPSLAQICKGINSALEHTQNDQAHVSAAWWTAHDNLVLTGSPNTSAQNLQLATPTICQHFSECYNLDWLLAQRALVGGTEGFGDFLPCALELPAVYALARVTLYYCFTTIFMRRDKLQPNLEVATCVPTRVSPSSHASTPNECHAALVANNPAYASLTIRDYHGLAKPARVAGLPYTLVIAALHRTVVVVAVVVTAPVAVVVTALPSLSSLLSPHRRHHYCCGYGAECGGQWRGWEPMRGSGGSTCTMRHIDCLTMPVVGVSGSRVGPGTGTLVDTILLCRGQGCRWSASIGTVAAVVVATTGPAMVGHQQRLVAHAACSSGLHRGCAICPIGLMAIVDSARGSGFICRTPAAVVTAVVCCVVVVRLISAGYNTHSPAELSEQFRTMRANGD
ncbi:hypothetical protein EDB85DRAFT_1887626 [Lactarius pseudohatsudake]|nr:hypothetical protein EDB85DRAFT_1887626 [Lactarius pseudohatsudake]